MIRFRTKKFGLKEDVSAVTWNKRLNFLKQNLKKINLESNNEERCSNLLSKAPNSHKYNFRTKFALPIQVYQDLQRIILFGWKQFDDFEDSQFQLLSRRFEKKLKKIFFELIFFTKFSWKRSGVSMESEFPRRKHTSGEAERGASLRFKFYTQAYFGVLKKMLGHSWV